MENQKGGLKFDDALKFVQPRPWLVDDLGKPRTYLTFSSSNIIVLN